MVYVAGLLVGVWAAGIFVGVGMWLREVFSPRGGTGVGFALPSACFTFSSPFLWAAATSDGPWVIWIFPSVITGAGVIWLIEALLDRRRAWMDARARLAPVVIGHR